MIVFFGSWPKKGCGFFSGASLWETRDLRGAELVWSFFPPITVNVITFSYLSLFTKLTRFPEEGIDLAADFVTLIIELQ